MPADARRFAASYPLCHRCGRSDTEETRRTEIPIEGHAEKCAYISEHGRGSWCSIKDRDLKEVATHLRVWERLATLTHWPRHRRQ